MVSKYLLRPLARAKSTPPAALAHRTRIANASRAHLPIRAPTSPTWCN